MIRLKDRLSFRAENGWISVTKSDNEFFVPNTIICIGIPWIKLGKDQTGDFGDSFKTWSLEAPTTIKYILNDDFRSFSLIIMGFGFGISRQTSY